MIISKFIRIKIYLWNIAMLTKDQYSMGITSMDEPSNSRYIENRYFYDWRQLHAERDESI